LNLGHYKNSADLEEASFIAGQPCVHLDIGENTSEEEWKTANPNGIKFGSRSAVISRGGHLELIQANPNQLPDQLQKRKEEQMVAIGARLINPPGGRETAEAAKIRFSSQNSALYVITTNISLALSSCLAWAQEFMSDAIEFAQYNLNNQFYEESADPNLLTAQIMLLDKGIISKTDLRAYGRKTGFISDNRTDEELDAESAPVQIPELSTEE
jgi:hypothetical protein